MSTIICLLVTLICLPFLFSAAENFPLSIIHINDFHARFEPTDTSGGTCSEGCIGGYARTVYTVRRLLEEQKDSNPIYLNAGDSFQGTLWYNIGRWNVTQEFLNIEPADAMTLGNHEFDHGIDGVVPFLEHLNTEMLVANMDSTNEPTIQGKYKKSTILERSGRKIGLIGVILETTYDLANTEQLIFRNESDAIREEATELLAQGVNIIIVISHCGYDVDKLIAATAGDVIDVIVGAHSHTFLYTGDTPPGPDSSRGDYPTEVTHSTGHRVLIVQAGAYAKYVGNITVYFDDDGNVVDFEGAPLYMSADVPQDEEVLAALAPWKEIVDEQGDVVVGHTKVDLTKSDCAAGECNLGNYFCDAMVHSYANLTAYDAIGWSNVSIGIINVGGLRVPLNQGDIEVLRALAPWQVEIDAKGDRVVGNSRVYLQQAECSRGECNLGNFYTDSMLHAFVKRAPMVVATNWSNVTIALTTQGNFRVPIPAGNITFKQLVTMCPWENRLFALTLKGSDLRNLLEDSVAPMNANSLTKPSSKRFLQVAGLRVSYNLSRSVGNRVVRIDVRCADCVIPQYKSLVDEQDYRLVVMEYLANGKNGFTLISNNAKDIESGPYDLDAFIDYLMVNQPVIAGLERRIQFVT